VQYIDPATGACIACVAQSCPAGYEAVACTRTAQGQCSACPRVAGDARVFVQPGSCSEVYLRLPAPCQAGYYQVGTYCEACPAYSATLLSGATRLEQCKCWVGLRRVGGVCSSSRLYSHDPQASSCPRRERCKVPPNAALANSTAAVDVCAWECNAGFYRAYGAGFNSQCQPCLSAPNNGTFVTRGDDEAPYSCE